MEGQEMTEELCGEFKKAENPLKTETASGSPLAGQVQKEDIKLDAVQTEKSIHSCSLK